MEKCKPHLFYSYFKFGFHMLFTYFCPVSPRICHVGSENLIPTETIQRTKLGGKKKSVEAAMFQW